MDIGQYSNMDDFGLMYYTARWYDPSLGRFTQADTIVPDGVQGYDRYAYVNNNPVRYIDPTEHKPCDDEFGNCLKPLAKRVKPPQLPKAPINGACWVRDNLLSEGTIYASTWVIPQSQVRDAWLSSKAEENYTLNLPSANMPYWHRLTNATTGIASDFHNDFDRYPIAAEINWQLRESGLLINSLEVKSYSPSFVAVENVTFFSAYLNTTVVWGPKTVTGINGNAPGIINMEVNFRPSRIFNTTMEINFTSVPSFPKHPYVAILIPAGVIPSAGCSFPMP